LVKEAKMRKLSILYLSNRPVGNSQASTVTEYLDAMKKYSCHDIYEISMLGRFPKKIKLEKFDVVMTHYSLSLGPLITHYLGKKFFNELRNFKGLKVAFLQDEYREIKTYWKNLNQLGVDVLFSCVPSDEIQKAYPMSEVPKLCVENVLTGYVPEDFLKSDVPEIKDRKTDVGYRTRKMPFWLGELGKEKWYISERFGFLSKPLDISVDLSIDEKDRLYGESWENFLMNTKCVLGVESGASIIDFDGKLEKVVDAYVDKNPNATFEEVHAKFLSEYEGNLKLNQISPRCFEAAALRTVMILFEGEYSGILKPDRHYISLAKDFSNFDEVINKVKDSVFLQQMADVTYKEVACNPKYSYSSFISKIDRVVEREFNSRCDNTKKNNYNQAEFDADLRASFAYRVMRYVMLIGQKYVLGSVMTRRILFWTWEHLPLSAKKIARPFAKLVSK
jgi:hypothetical protein